METRYLNIEHLPRLFSVAPPVRSIANMINHRLEGRQVIAGIQICLRFHGASDNVCGSIDGKEYRATYPHIIIKRQGEVHLMSGENVADSFYFTYLPEQAPAIPDDLAVSEITLTPEIHAHIHHILELLPRSYESGVTDRIDGLCLQLLVELLLLHRHRGTASEDADRIEKISSYLQIHFTEVLDFDAVARHFGYSPRSFYRHWQQCHGVPPATYVAHLKLAEAKRLLTEDSLSIEAISKRLRYSSSAYFVYCFRKHSGKTPLQYRKASSHRGV